ncbi:MAG: nucleoside deaminase [Chitinophagales bacterium]|nr:nucleoside deaminase [Chitinophagales bacterium]MCO5281707.1 nucleoside deaminase [Chitinophagales bacterium]OJV29092.1 MAG: tRNA-specific adenosine deaminase [Bacteroidetes bacterium 37-13]HRP39863.1 nucleoside deaminase [Chitinophagales bacterium]
MQRSHEYFMKLALKEAVYAFEEDEVPIGAVVVCKNQVIGKGYNQVEKLTDVTAHAEMIAITAASNYLGSKFLEECEIYVTVEPCLMCATALRWARIGKIIYGTGEPKTGFTTFQKTVLHPTTEIVGGVLENECAELMRQFFKGKRL